MSGKGDLSGRALGDDGGPGFEGLIGYLPRVESTVADSECTVYNNEKRLVTIENPVQSEEWCSRVMARQHRISIPREGSQTSTTKALSASRMCRSCSSCPRASNRRFAISQNEVGGRVERRCSWGSNESKSGWLVGAIAIIEPVQMRTVGLSCIACWPIQAPISKRLT